MGFEYCFIIILLILIFIRINSILNNYLIVLFILFITIFIGILTMFIYLENSDDIKFTLDNKIEFMGNILIEKNYRGFLVNILAENYKDKKFLKTSNYDFPEDLIHFIKDKDYLREIIIDRKNWITFDDEDRQKLLEDILINEIDLKEADIAEFDKLSILKLIVIYNGDTEKISNNSVVKSIIFNDNINNKLKDELEYLLNIPITAFTKNVVDYSTFPINRLNQQIPYFTKEVLRERSGWNISNNSLYYGDKFIKNFNKLTINNVNLEEITFIADNKLYLIKRF